MKAVNLKVASLIILSLLLKYQSLYDKIAVQSFDLPLNVGTIIKDKYLYLHRSTL